MYSMIKSILDRLIALCILVLLSPLFFIITFVLSVQNQGQPFFKQRRPGYKERPFTLMKFKSMTDERDENGHLLPDNKRITPLGAFLRKTSLDELPQLINVLKGDMSIVGPRPLLMRYLPMYTDEQHRRHDVKPGITGLAQVNGRNSIGWTKKFQYDVYYVDHQSFLLDLKILFRTVFKVIRREGVNQSAERPMQPFTKQKQMS